MSQHLDANSSSIQETKSQLESVTSSLEYQLAQAAVDAAGIVDPTPVSDVIGAGMSLASGDFFGAGLSLISVVPYVGDALGKTVKGARLLDKINDLRKQAAALTAKLNKATADARKKAAEAVRARRKAEAAKKAGDNANCTACKQGGNRFGTNLPREGRGKWDGERGNGRWHPDRAQDPELYDSLPEGQKYIDYKDGYPDFSSHSQGSVEIDYTASRNGDFGAADAAMRDKLGDPNWQKPEGYTWHHKEDGTTMELIPTEIHGNAPHTGGRSIGDDAGF